MSDLPPTPEPQPSSPPPSGPPASSSGLAPNVAGALSYLFGIITGIAFLLIEKENRFVRFHAAQSVVISGSLIALSIVMNILGAILAMIPVVNLIMGIVLVLFWLLVGLGGFILWLVLMFRAYQGDEWRVPLAADYADKILATPAVQ
jgi:uncharacterized membrane protein